jgi:PAS domain S-box-containing protein
MSLQRRLLWLLVAFAAFCLLSTFGVIYAVHLHVGQAMTDLRQTQSEAAWLEQLRLTIRERYLDLRAFVLANPNAAHPNTAASADVFDQLHQVARYTLQRGSGTAAEELLALGTELRTAFADCARRAATGDAPGAQAALAHIETTLLPHLDEHLRLTLATLNKSRSSAVDTVVVTNTQLLSLAIAVGLLGGGFVLASVYLIRRWVLIPVRQLEAATTALGAGQLDHRVAPGPAHELGRLGRALNDMAEKLTAARAELAASEAKYRALFHSLRDATLICSTQGQIVECQDGETALLGRLERECIGRSIIDVCPVGGTIDWAAIFGRVVTANERVVVSDLRLERAHDPSNSAIVDVIAFPVRWGHDSYVALVLRDVTEQRRSQQQLRRTEAMQATITLARGVAHDFGSLLTTAIGSLSVASAELTEGRPGEMVRRAMQACGQAARLSSTLLTFAGGERGSPEALPLRETIELIMQSLADEQLDNIDLRLELADVTAYIDRDQFTEITLNLVHNACEAMPDGGTLTVRLEPAKLPAATPAEGPPTHALLTVADTGCGIDDDTRERLFEPFFTTKSQGTKRSRGIGLSVVYAAVMNAGGTIDVVSAPGCGATFRVWLPFPEQPGVSPP